MQLKGVEKGIRLLAGIQRELEKQAIAMALELAGEIRVTAQRWAPISELMSRGSLKRSIRVERKGKKVFVKAGGKRDTSSGIVVDYPVYVEFGTSRMTAQPYLRPAIALHMRSAPKQFAKTLQQAVAREVLRRGEPGPGMSRLVDEQAIKREFLRARVGRSTRFTVG